MSAPLTKTEALRLARIVRKRGYGSYTIDVYHSEFSCPLDAERQHPYPGHRVTVWKKPWEKITAPMIDKAFVAHFCAKYEDERCDTLL